MTAAGASQPADERGGRRTNPSRGFPSVKTQPAPGLQLDLHQKLLRQPHTYTPSAEGCVILIFLLTHHKGIHILRSHSTSGRHDVASPPLQRFCVLKSRPDGPMFHTVEHANEYTDEDCTDPVSQGTAIHGQAQIALHRGGNPGRADGSRRLAWLDDTGTRRRIVAPASCVAETLRLMSTPGRGNEDTSGHC